MKKHYHSYSNKFYKGIENIVNCKIIDYQVWLVHLSNGLWKETDCENIVLWI